MIAKESPLKGMQIGTVATVAIRELPGMHTIDLRVEPGSATHAAVTEALGMDLPVKPGQTSVMSYPAELKPMLCVLHRTGG